jgi:hypothetical protein
MFLSGGDSIEREGGWGRLQLPDPPSRDWIDETADASGSDSGPMPRTRSGLARDALWNDMLSAENRAMIDAVHGAVRSGKPPGEIVNIMLAAKRKVRRKWKKEDKK